MMCFQIGGVWMSSMRNLLAVKVIKYSRCVIRMHTCSTKAANIRAVQSVKYVGIGMLSIFIRG